MKKLFALIMALVMLPAAALGASARDVRNTDIDPGSGVNTLLDVIATAAMLKDVRSLSEGETPSEGLAEAVFAVYSFAETDGSEVRWSEEDLREIYRAFFAAGPYTLPEKGDCTCVSIEDGVMTLDLSELYETPLAGVWITENRLLENGQLYIKGDVFTAWGYFLTSAWDVPNEDLTWYCTMEACLEAPEDSLYGWRVVSYSLGEIWLDGSVSLWPEFVEETAGYSLLVPAVLGVSGEDPARREWQTGDGQVTMTVEVLPGMDEAAGDQYFEGEPFLIKQSPWDGLATWAVEGPERARLLIAGTDLKSAYLVTLTYPEERQDEMTLYLEFMRNSFNEAGSTNG